MGALLVPLLTRIAPVLIGALAAFIAGCVLIHKIDADDLDKLKAQYAQAQVAAVTAAMKQQQAYDTDAQAAAQKDQQQQTALAANTDQLKQEIIRYVPVTKSCVPVGLVSVLRGAIGLSTPNVPAAAGKSDDACSTVGWPDLARGIIDAFGKARANSSQLDALEGFINQAHKDAGK